MTKKYNIVRFKAGEPTGEILRENLSEKEVSDYFKENKTKETKDGKMIWFDCREEVKDNGKRKRV